MSDTPAIPFHLTIGVTGHRTLENVEELCNTIRNVFDDVLKRNSKGKHTEIKLSVLSPLAEGTDRLVAKEVLEYDQYSMLKAVLPLCKSDYLDDFKTRESKEEFKQLLSQARFSLTLRKRELVDDYSLPMLAEARRNAYEDVGKFVVERCDVLIAIWDGEPSRSKGECGTADIVQYAEEVNCPRYIIDSADPSHYKYKKGDGITKDILKKIDTFNKQIINAPAQDDYIQNEYNHLFSEEGIPEAKNIPEDVKSLLKEKLIPYYTAASSVATECQHAYHKTGKKAFWLAFLAVVIVGAGIIFLHTPSYIFGIEFLILGYIFFTIWRADRKRVHKNWLEHRFFAERIRAGFFMASAGMEISPFFIRKRVAQAVVPKTGDNNQRLFRWIISLLKRQKLTPRDTSSWMLLAFKEIWAQLPKQAGSQEDTCREVGEYLKKSWIEGQITYHEKKYRDSQFSDIIDEMKGEIIFFIAFGLALAHFIIPMINKEFHHSLTANVLTLATLIFPPLAATVESIRFHSEYKRLYVRSRKMAVELNELNRSFRLLSPGKLEYIVRKTEKIMLDESMDWLALMSPLDLHKVV